MYVCIEKRSSLQIIGQWKKSVRANPTSLDSPACCSEGIRHSCPFAASSVILHDKTLSQRAQSAKKNERFLRKPTTECNSNPLICLPCLSPAHACFRKYVLYTSDRPHPPLRPSILLRTTPLQGPGYRWTSCRSFWSKPRSEDHFRDGIDFP